MEHFQTQWFTNGNFQILPGKPEDHNLMSTASYSFERDDEHWTIFLAEEITDISIPFQ